MNVFDWPTLPLSGARLVEASAGTGKTWAVAALYVRLLLGHGDAGSAHRSGPLDVRRILVVTYTIAATNELRDRIRGRLNALRVNPDELSELRLDATDLARIELALTELDEAQITTIHGFCQRVLRSFPVECGMPWQWDYVIDDSALWQQAVNDFWRREIVPLGGTRAREAAHLMDAWWKTPVHLNRDLARLRIRNRLDITGGETPVADAFAAVRDTLEELGQHWRRHNVRAALESAGRISGAKDKAGNAANLDDLNALLADGVTAVTSPMALLELYSTAWIGPDGRHLLKRGTEFEDTRFLQLVDSALAALTELRASVLRQAFEHTAELAVAARVQSRQLAPDDLVEALARALRGPEGIRLAGRIRELWPAAMIDEFQDTDAAQCEIFERIWGDREDVARIAIGDPKQSIFGFRGADLFSYVDARDALPSAARYTMQVNWRSSHGYVDAMNALYAHNPAAFVAAGVQYVPVSASPAAPPDCAGAALQFMWVPRPDKLNMYGEADDRCARACAARVADLVNGGGVAPGRVAVIVRSRTEANRVRDALANVGLRAAYLSRDPVLATAEARDLLRVLSAIIDPGDARALRGALASQMFEADLPSMAADFGNDERWAETVQRWRGYLLLWRRGGVLSALTHVLRDHNVPARLLRCPDGARRLTDLRHVAELLEEQAALTPAPLALHRWLAAMIEAPDTENETRQLRLESDEALVRVVTIHGAKGLEYDYVMLPTVGSRGMTGSDFWAWFHAADDRGQHRGVAALVPSTQDEQLAATEVAAEEARLLYVALTRARLQCVVAVCNMSTRFAESPLGALLSGVGATKLDDQVLRDRLTTIAATSDHLELVEAPDAQPADSDASGETDTLVLPVTRTFAGRIERNWRVSSYSALTRSADEPRELPGLADEQADTRVVFADPQDAAAAFPRGPGPGVALHAILERWPEAEAPDADTRAAELLRRELAGIGVTSAAQLQQAGQWLEQVRHTPLAPLAVDLTGLTDVNRELEFHLHIRHARTDALLALMAGVGMNAAPLPTGELHGLLRGFIDLVFQHNGRYYLVDYKSNWLAPHASGYDRTAMDTAIAEHRYDLQYLIYAVALRRFLRASGGAAAADAYGGGFYLFLRGMDGGAGGTGIWHAPPDVALLDAVDGLFS